MAVSCHPFLFTLQCLVAAVAPLPIADLSGPSFFESVSSLVSPFPQICSSSGEFPYERASTCGMQRGKNLANGRPGRDVIEAGACARRALPGLSRGRSRYLRCKFWAVFGLCGRSIYSTFDSTFLSKYRRATTTLYFEKPGRFSGPLLLS